LSDGLAGLAPMTGPFLAPGMETRAALEIGFR